MATIFFGDANLPWISPLCDEVGKNNYVNRITFPPKVRVFDLLKTLSTSRKGDSEQVQVWNYPPGFNSILSFIYRPLIARRLQRIVSDVSKKTGEIPYIFISDANLAKYISNTINYKVVYLIYDLYSKENEEVKSHKYLVDRSEIVLSSSMELVNKIKLENPDCVDKIRYFPHGSNTDFINPNINNRLEKNQVVINGYLSARYNWETVYEVIGALKDVNFLFVGNIVLADFEKNREVWFSVLEKVKRMPNVTHISNLPHNLTIKYYWESTIVWLPYDLNIEFNKYSCPMKIMDGLCSGRPVISTGISESRSHQEYINICDDSKSTILKIKSIIENKDMPKSILKSESQIKYAEQNSWANRAIQYLSILR